ncbi:MAG: hypothetical protein Kow0096_04530 [Thiohalomonadaceae bacterium]
MELHPKKSLLPYAGYWFASTGFILLFFAAAMESLAAPVSSQYWALFNTVCARCHEAQCSGRLSLGDMQSRAHVERYAGTLSDDLHQQLVGYLQYMKEYCSFTAFPFAPAPPTSWLTSQLALFQTPAGDAYFVPLGSLANGTYRLQARLQGKNWVAQVIAGNFDVIAETLSCNQGEEFGMEFRVDAGKYYLRVTGREPLQLQQVRLLALPSPNH